MPTARAWLWWLRRRAAAWLRDRYSDGSTIITVWLHEWRAVVPRGRDVKRAIVIVLGGLMLTLIGTAGLLLWRVLA